MTTGLGAWAIAAVLAANGAAQDTEWANQLLQGEKANTDGHYTEGLAFMRQAAALAQGFGPRDERTWVTYNGLAVAYENAGFPADSVRTYHQVMGLVKGAIGKQNAVYARLMGNLGYVYLQEGNIPSAGDMLREALRIQARIPGLDPVQSAQVQSRMAEVQVYGHRYADAERMIASSLPVLEAAGENMDTATTLGSLGILRRYQRRYGEAADAMERQIGMLETQFGKDNPLLIRPLNNLSVVYTLARRMDQAGNSFRRALAICEKALPANHPSHAMILINYAAYLRDIGEKTQAKTAEAEAVSLARDNARRDGLAMTVDASAFRK